MEIGILTQVVGCIGSAIIPPLIQLIDDVINLEQNRDVLQTDFSRMRNLLLAISNYSQDQQKSLPETVKDWLQRVQGTVEEAKHMINRSDRRKHCLCHIKQCKRIRQWNAKFDKLFGDLQTDFSIFVSAQQIVDSPTPQEAQLLLQPLPESGFVGSGIKAAEIQLQEWLNSGPDDVRVIGLYGMAGVGKTSLLKIIYNMYKVSNIFDHVIWITVSPNYDLIHLQSRIARNLRLNIDSNNSDIDMAKMELWAYLRKKKILLILDDIWRRLDVEELGITFGDNYKGSKVVISTRSIEVTRTMRADAEMRIQPLSADEAWELFHRVVFRGSEVPDKNTEDIGREIARECQGLPLAINVVAAAMICKTILNEWQLALDQMKTVDPAFPATYIGVDAQLYQRLKWSYDHLPDSNLKNCFLHCAMFPEGEEILVDRLVQMWIAEGFVKSRNSTGNLMDVGRSYVKLLADPCLIEEKDAGQPDVVKVEEISIWDPGMECVKIHDVLRDLAIYISEKEENCLFRAGQSMQSFPIEQLESQDACRRISVANNNITCLPKELRCPNLQCLILSGNPNLKEVPEGFLYSLRSLRVLDLSGTQIKSLPKSVEQLIRLEFLALRETNIQHLPQNIHHLSSLQFLDLNRCQQLKSLPSTIGELKNLKHLYLRGCNRLTVIPSEFHQLTSLQRLELGKSECALSVKAIAKFRNLMDLDVTVQVGSTMGTMGTWLDMRNLRLIYKNNAAVLDWEDILPDDIENMKKLKRCILQDYPGTILPECICEFQHLESLALYGCPKLEELPALERLPNLRSLSIEWCKLLKYLRIGSWGRAAGFPKLETLSFQYLEKIESMAGPDGCVWNEQTMPQLRVLTVHSCKSLTRFPIGMQKLPNLQRICGGGEWWDEIIWEDENMKICLQKLFEEYFRIEPSIIEAVDQACDDLALSLC